jgi:predicted kinase
VPNAPGILSLFPAPFGDRTGAPAPTATLHILCGLPCSGKTLLANRLETTLPALNLCSDTWMSRIVADGYNHSARHQVEAIQLELATRALQLGVSVILQWGFWHRADREEACAAAASVGARAQIHFLDVPLEELVRRLLVRNADLPPNTFHVAPQDLVSWAGEFEPPTTEELLAPLSGPVQSVRAPRRQSE